MSLHGNLQASKRRAPCGTEHRPSPYHVDSGSKLICCDPGQVRFRCRPSTGQCPRFPPRSGTYLARPARKASSSGHARSGIASDPQSAVVGELVRAVLSPANFSKSHSELRFQFLTFLAGSHGLRCSCAPDVPFAVIARPRQSRRFYRRPCLVLTSPRDLGRCS